MQLTKVSTGLDWIGLVDKFSGLLCGERGLCCVWHEVSGEIGVCVVWV